MANRTVRVVILCEGSEDYDFARRALVRLGWDKRLFEPRISPADRGSGEQFVRESYPAEVQGRRARQGRKLLVMTDADSLQATARANTLARALRDARQKPRSSKEPVAHWIPKRNLETWAYLYAHGSVDEKADYKLKISEADLSASAVAWGDDLKRKSIEPRKSLSLRRAMEETLRIR